VRLLGGDGRLYREPAWSPDGARMAFACADEAGGRTHLELLDISTGARRLLTADPERSDGRPAFSPDGNQLFFEGAAAGDVAVYGLDLDANQLARVTERGRVSRRPAPLSGDLVVVEQLVDEKGPMRLVLVDRLGVRERPLAHDDAADAGHGDEQREPSAHITRRGKVRLAYTALVGGNAGEPRRFDVCVARLKGVSLSADVEAAAAEEAPAPEGADAGSAAG
jgi:dipeptidyl aminopeptidase/acylaminoacyl peptidase